MAYEQTKKQAEAKAAALCARLGANWQPRAWENLGWCYAARLGGLEVFEYDYLDPPFRYSAFLHEPDHTGGLWVGRGYSPVEAVADALAIARREIAYKSNVVRLAAEALAESNRLDLAVYGSMHGR